MSIYWKKRTLGMVGTYKNMIRKRAEQYTKRIWEACELTPNFNIRKVIEYFDGQIYPDINNRLADYEEAEIFETNKQKNFEIIYKLRCEITDEDNQILKYQGEMSQEQKEKRNAIIDKHLENRFIRYAIAHEIGHLFLHMISIKEGSEYVIEGDYKRNIKDGSMIEWEAEEFAKLLLMPETTFRFYYEKLELIIGAQEKNQEKIQEKIIDEMVNKFGVEHSEVFKRGRSLNIW